ncbi:hypothetical protein DERF_004308, partial [Dermatophagoides farinae]
MGEKQKQKNFKEKIEFKIWNLQGYFQKSSTRMRMCLKQFWPNQPTNQPTILVVL